MGALSVPPLVQINTQQGLPSVSSKKRRYILRPQSTASSRPWSRELHPVGALSVPPLVQINTPQGLPIVNSESLLRFYSSRVEWKFFEALSKETPQWVIGTLV